MISLLTPERERDFLNACLFDEVIGARMVTLLRCYGFDFTPCRLWLMIDPQNRPAAAIARFDGWLTVSAGESADLAELSAFADAIGEFSYIEASPRVCKAFRFTGKYESSSIMRYGGGAFCENYGIIDENPQLPDIYKVVCAANVWFQNTTSWPGWYTHTSHLFRHGLGFAGMICENGRPVSTGGVYTMGEHAAVIGCLATLPQCRGKGYASLLAKYLTDKILAKGKTPALFCAGDTLADYYKSLGFEKSGEWGELILQRSG